MLGIPLAALGFLAAVVAAATMTLSSVFVVWNSLRLRRFSVSGPRPAADAVSVASKAMAGSFAGR